MHNIGMDPSRMIRETAHNHQQEDKEGNTMKLLNSEHNKEDNEKELNTDLIHSNKIMKKRIWKICVLTGKTLFAYLHFHSKKIKKFDFELPFQFEGIPFRDKIFSGTYFLFLID